MTSLSLIKLISSKLKWLKWKDGPWQILRLILLMCMLRKNCLKFQIGKRKKTSIKAFLLVSWLKRLRKHMSWILRSMRNELRNISSLASQTNTRLLSLYRYRSKSWSRTRLLTFRQLLVNGKGKSPIHRKQRKTWVHPLFILSKSKDCSRWTTCLQMVTRTNK